MARYVGMDVHKRSIQVCCISDRGDAVFNQRIPCERDAVTRFAKNKLRSDDNVALEATTNTWAVVDLLRPLVKRVAVSNPLKTKAIAEATVKTDKIDARVLAQLLRTGFLPEVWIPDEQTQKLRRMTHRRAALTGDMTAIKNRIHSLLHQRLIHPTVKKLFCKPGVQWLEQLELDEEGKAALCGDLRLLNAVRHERDWLDQAIEQQAYEDRRIPLLMTLPGVSVAVATALVAAWGDPARFPDADRAASYLGLVPSTKQSADHCYHGPITKHGSSNARWLLIQAAQHAGRHAGPIGVSFRRLCRRKNRNVAIVACARKLARIAWMMLRNGEPYRYAMPATTRTKLASLRVRVTGERRPTGQRRRSVPNEIRREGLRVQIVPPLFRRSTKSSKRNPFQRPAASTR